MEEHHIFGGTANRRKSERYGLTVLHQYGQRKYMEEQDATVEDFRREFGRNYL